MKKIISALIVLSIIASIFIGMTTVSMATESTGNFVWIESANMTRDGGGFGTVANGSTASGGNAVVNWNTQGGLTANFTVSEGTYDIWFLGQQYATYATQLDWKIDGGTPYTKYAISNYQNVGTVDAAYPVNCWHKLNSQVYFTEGTHTLRIGATAPNSSGKYTQLYDAVVIVPSGMLWKPSGLTKPTQGQIAGGYTYIEGANFTYADCHSIYAQAGSDRGTVARFYQSGTGAESAIINYDFMVDETAEYDIWVLGSQNVAWLTTYGWKLDEAENYDASTTQALRQPYNWTVGGADQGVFLYKVASGENITAGKHNIGFEVKKRADGSIYNLIDTILIVPTSAKWAWANGAGVTAAMLSLDKATLNVGKTSEIREDFTLPSYGQSGSKITWTSDSEAIAINGNNAVITRPAADSADALVTLTATITRDGSSATKNISVTVPKVKAEITTDKPYNVFQTNEEHKVTFNFQGVYEQDTEVSYSVTDYFGNTVISDSVTLKGGKKNISCILNGLESGHYTVTAKAGDEEISTYIAVVKAFSERRKYDDTPFAMTTASMTFVDIPELDDYMQMLKLAGVGWVREHTGFNWTMNSQTEMVEPISTNIKDYYYKGFENAGINVLNMVYGAAEWQQTETDKGYMLPDDLMSYYNSWKTYATYFGDKVDMYEINNEPDGGYTTDNESAAIYAASLKAAYIAVKDAGKAQGKEFMVSNAGLQHKKEYFFELAENDMFKYTDIYNDHLHAHAMEPIGSWYEPVTKGFKQKMDWKETVGASGMSLWLSEAGIGIENTAGEPLSEEKQKIQAHFLIANNIESLAQGTDKHFAFLASAYDEKSRQWGITTEEHTPYPSYSAYAAMTATLGQGRFMGTVDTGEDMVKAYWFDNGENKVLALWSENDTDVTLNFGLNNVKMVDFMGKETQISHNGTYTAKAEKAVKYFVIDGEIPGGSYIKGEKTEILQPVSDELTKAERVVLLPRFDNSSRTNARYDGYSLAASGSTVSVQVYNFNDEAMTGTISGYGEGWTITNNSQTVTIPAMSSVTLTFNVKANAIYNAGKSSLTFVGTFNGEETSKAVSKVHLSSYPSSSSFKVQNLTLTDSAGSNVVDAVSGGETITLSIKAQRSSYTSQTIKVVLGVYNSEDVLEDVVLRNMTPSWIGSTTDSFSYTLPTADEKYYIKAMVWNGNLQPIIIQKKY